MNFVFENTTRVYFGDQLGKLGEVLSSLGRRVLLVYGGGSIKRNGLYDKVVDQLHQAGLEFAELSGVEPNPRHTTVNRGVRICREQGVEVILAVGGGSTIDCAKGIAATVFAPTDNVWDLVEGKKQFTQALPIVTVLTLSATGSEMDTGSVLSNMDLNIKSGLISPLLRPRVTFEDPTVTYTVNAYQTASGSVDIMSHIFDVAYFSLQPQLEMCRNLQEEVLRTVISNTVTALREPENYEARANLMWASSWALNDFLYCGVQQCPVLHAIEHELSAHYDITHGHGLAILTPHYLHHILNAQTAPVIYRFGRVCLEVESGLKPQEGAERTCQALSDLYFNRFGLKPRLSDLGIDDSKFALMAHVCCSGLFASQGKLEALGMLTEEDVQHILRQAL